MITLSSTAVFARASPETTSPFFSVSYFYRIELNELIKKTKKKGGRSVSVTEGKPINLSNMVVEMLQDPTIREYLLRLSSAASLGKKPKDAATLATETVGIGGENSSSVSSPLLSSPPPSDTPISRTF